MTAGARFESPSEWQGHEGGGVWGGGVPLPIGGGVWGGGYAPENFLKVLAEINAFC